MSDRQADAVLGMPLRRLTGLERTNLQKEFEELTVKVAGLQKVLNDRHELLKALKKDLRSLKKQFGDARRTRIVQSNTPPKTIKVPKTRSPKAAAVVPMTTANKAVVDELVVDITAEEIAIETESPIEEPSSPIVVPKSFKPPVKPAPKVLELEEAENAIELTQSGLIRRVGLTAYEADHALSIHELEELFTPVEDPTVQTEFLMLDEELLVLTVHGKIYPLAVKDIPKGDGVSLLSCLPSSAGTENGTIVALFTLPEDADDQALLILTKQGKIKRIALSELSDVSNRGLVAFKLKDDDRVCQMGFVEEGDQLVICTSMGRVIRVEINRDTLPLTSRTATGVQLTKVLKLERFVGWAIAGYEDEFLMVSAQGYGKRMTVGVLKLCNFGDLGQHVFQFTQKSDTVVGMTVAFPETSIAIGTQDNQWLKLPIEQIPLGVREDKGEQMELVAGQIVMVVRAIE